VLSSLATDAGLALTRKPKVIFTGAENVTASLRRQIEGFTGARIADQYGFAEGCGNAATCPEGVYHEDFELGVMECVDPTPAPGGGTRGKVVCTGLVEENLPLIRYVVGDSGTWAPPDRRCGCGRHSRILLHIDGREEDYVLTPEGNRILRFDYLFKDTPDVAECQVVQYKPAEVVLRIIPTAGYQAPREEAKLRELVKHWISEAMTVSFEYPADLPREANGKFRPVKSYLSSS
jgi:phenylacetate-CoA ligase